MGSGARPRHKLVPSPKAMLAAIVAASEGAIVTYDAQARITSFSPSAEAMFGYTEDEVVGQPMQILVPKRLAAMFTARFEAFVRSDESVYTRTLEDPVVMVRKSGREFLVRISAGKTQTPQGPVLAFFVRDLSQSDINAELALSQAKLAGIINFSEDAIISLDEQQRITLFNPAAARTFGYTQAEVLGQSVEMLIPERLRRRYRQYVRGFVNSSDEKRQMNLTGPITAIRKDGEEFPAESAVSRFSLNGEQIAAVRLHDVSERARSEEMRIRLLAAEESSRLKMQLLSTVSHELRSPLSAILGFTSLLIDYDERLSREERQQQLKVIEDSTRHLQRIVDDLLTLSRLEAGVIDIERAPVPLSELFEAIQTLFGSIETHALKFTPHSTDLVVTGDEARLRQVLGNLIDNAIKYTPPGGEIEIDARRKKDSIAITVRDYGPGVAPEEVGIIFEAFYRGANASTSEEIRSKSTGLGLAICKGFVEAHGGEIHASLPPGGGLAITFSLPLAGAETEAPQPAGAPRIDHRG